jgi:hypothetical protein
MDLWYNAHKAAGTLPGEFAGMTLREITDSLGVGFHAVVPDFSGDPTPDSLIDRLLGIYRVRNMPFETHLGDVERTVSDEDGRTRVAYRTAKGGVTGVFGYTEEMRRAGVSIPWVFEPLVKSADDLKVLAHIYSNLEVTPARERYADWHSVVGEAGAAVAYASPSASPVHHVMHEVMPVTDFFLALHDYPREMGALAEGMEGWFEAVLAAVAESLAEVVFWGANYDATITFPPFFEKHILPWLARAADTVHEAGKFLLTHTDGENRGLIDLFRRSGFDVADSFCPAPMTKMTLPEFAEALPNVTVWGGIPSVSLCREMMSDEDFERLLDETLEFARGRPRIILSAADTLPPGADFERLLEITRRING